MQLYASYTDAYFDALIDKVHTYTPLMSLPFRGRIFCGLDDIHGLRELVSEYGIHAAVAETRNDALLQSCIATPGRIDAHQDAENVPVSALASIVELEIDHHDVERLRLFGLDTIGKLRALSERHLLAQFGQQGRVLYHFLHEHDNSPLPFYVPSPSVIIVERYDESQQEPGPIFESLDQATRRACTLLGSRLTWRVELAILDRFDDAVMLRERILRTGSNNVEQLLVHLQALCRELLSSCTSWWGLRVRFASLALPASEQTALFSPAKTADDIVREMMPRYAHVMRKVMINNPWSIIPEEYACWKPLVKNVIQGNSPDEGARA